MKSISNLVKDYYAPQSPKSTAQAQAIGAAAVGTLATERLKEAAATKRGAGGAGGRANVLSKSPNNEFLQSLTSHRVEYAANLLKTLAQELRRARHPEKVFEKYGITDREPLAAVSRLLTNALSAHLGSQAQTDLGFAAQDAIAKTIIDALSVAYPQGPEPAKIDRERFALAFKKLSAEELGTLFMRNAAGALVNLVLDATRGSISPGRIDELKEQVRKAFIPKLIEELKGRK